MQTAQVIPFKFDAREVRTLLVDDQPWFVAADVAASLEYRDSEKLTRMLDDDEKATQIVGTPGGEQKMLVINESGLYSAILRSRKAEAKRFKKWVTAEVLPAIRKHGRYEDACNKLGTLIGETIGTDGFHMLGAIVKGKVTSLPSAMQRRATAKIWSQTHAAFGVRSAADIPADQLDAARCFIAAYDVREGEWLEAEKPAPAKLDIHWPAERLAELSPHTYKGQTLSGPNARISIPMKGLCGMDAASPTLRLLGTLARTGYEVEACKLEVLAMRHHLESYWDACDTMQRLWGSNNERAITFKLTPAA